MSYLGARSIKTTLGPRGRGMGALGATGLTTQQQQVALLQAQINRFLATPIAITGQLDAATASHAMTIMLQRFTRAFVEDPGNAVTARLFADANRNLGNALPWVSSRLVEVTDTLRDFGDFIGKPPAQGSSSSSRSLKTAAIAVAGLVAIAFALRRKRR